MAAQTTINGIIEIEDYCPKKPYIYVSVSNDKYILMHLKVRADYAVYYDAKNAIDVSKRYNWPVRVKYHETSKGNRVVDSVDFGEGIQLREGKLVKPYESARKHARTWAEFQCGSGNTTICSVVIECCKPGGDWDLAFFGMVMEDGFRMGPDWNLATDDERRELVTRFGISKQQPPLKIKLLEKYLATD